MKLIRQLFLLFIHAFLLQLPSLNPASSLDNLLESSSESTIRRSPRHRYNIRNNPHPTSLASTNSSLFRHHAQSLSTDSLSILDSAPTSGVDTNFSQRSSVSSYNQTGQLFSRPASQNLSVLS